MRTPWHGAQSSLWSTPRLPSVPTKCSTGDKRLGGGTQPFDPHLKTAWTSKQALGIWKHQRNERGGAQPTRKWKKLQTHPPT